MVKDEEGQELMSYDEESHSWSRYEIWTYSDKVQVAWSTNDNLDQGWASEYAADTYSFDDVEAALKFTGKSRQGVLSKVPVLLDGEKVE